MNDKKERIITVRITEEQHKQIKALATQLDGIGVSFLIRHILGVAMKNVAEGNYGALGGIIDADRK